MKSENCGCDDDEIFIFVDKLQKAYCVACFIESELHKEIHAEELFINNYKFNKLREDDSREIKIFIDYHGKYGQIYSIIEILEKECEFTEDIWYSSMYKNMTIEKLLSKLDTNCCASTVNKGHRAFCDACKKNLRIVAYYNHIGRLDDIVKDWGSIVVPDNFIHEPIKLARYPVQCKELYDKSKQTNLKVFKFPKLWLINLESYIDELQNYDVLDMRPYFNGSVEPLIKLKNLKGLIFGSYFNENLDCLECLEHLEFIQLPDRYDSRLSEKIYNISFNYYLKGEQRISRKHRNVYKHIKNNQFFYLNLNVIQIF